MNNTKNYPLHITNDQMKSHLLLCVETAAIVFLVGCKCPEADQVCQSRKSLLDAARQLASVENDANLWGRITVSDIVLVDNQHQFKLDYAQSVTGYVNQARINIQGMARSSSQESVLAGLEAAASFQNPISFGQPPATNSPALPSASGILPDQARQTLSGAQFSGILTNSTQDIGLSERRAHMIAFNDKVAEQLMKLLTDPDSLPGDMRVFFGVMQVTCNPGLNSRDGYIGDVNVSMRYAKYVPTSNAGRGDPPNALASLSSGRAVFPVSSQVAAVKNKVETNQNSFSVLTVSRNKGPRVYALLPLLDAETLDLRSSRRYQNEFALGLAAAFQAKGLNASAKILADWVKRQESDTRTRSVVPLVTSYADGRAFGFRFFPELQAVASPTAKAGGPGQILQSSSFPAVVAALVSPEDLEAVESKEGPGSWTHCYSSASSRWIATRVGQDRQTPENKAALADRLDKANHFINSVIATNISQNNKVIPAMESLFQEVERSYNSLSVEAVGSGRPCPLPSSVTTTISQAPPAVPSIIKVLPETIVQTTSELAIIGKNLDNVTSVVLGNSSASILSAQKTSLIVKVPSNVRQLGNQTILTVVSSNSVVPYSNPITLAFGTEPGPPAITIGRDGTGKITAVTLTGDDTKLSEKERLDAMKEILRVSEAPPAVAPKQ